MKLSNINYKKGKVRILSDIDLSEPINNQIDMLTQDIAQITYSNNYTVDIGWYPIDMEITTYTFFKIYVIRNYNWENPVKEIVEYTTEGLKKSLISEIEHVSKLNID